MAWLAAGGWGLGLTVATAGWQSYEEIPPQPATQFTFIGDREETLTLIAGEEDK